MVYVYGAPYLCGSRWLWVWVPGALPGSSRTRWELLQQLDLSNCRRSLEPVYQAHISSLCKQLETLSGERVQLDSDLRNMKEVVEDYKKR